MKPNAHAIVPIFVTMLTLAGCSSPPDAHEHLSTSPPTVSTSPPTEMPAPLPTERARETGEAVGEELRDGWEVIKEFGKGLWDTLTEGRE
jgi:hypothetical protein